MVRGRQAKEHPHAEQSQPSENLDYCKLLHCLRHISEGARNLSQQLGYDSDYFHETGGAAVSLPTHALKLFHVFRWVFPGCEDGPQHREQKDDGADLERVLHCERNAAASSASHAELPKQPWQGVCQRGADADEKTLHDEAGGSLLNIQFVSDEGAEGLHADIDAGIQNPEQSGSHPERRRIRHEEECDTGEDGAGKKVWPTAAQSVPRSITH